MASHYISGRLQWLGLVLVLVLALNTNPNQLDHWFIRRIYLNPLCAWNPVAKYWNWHSSLNHCTTQTIISWIFTDSLHHMWLLDCSVEKLLLSMVSVSGRFSSPFFFLCKLLWRLIKTARQSVLFHVAAKGWISV